jgi:hypothetical protein
MRLRVRWVPIGARGFVGPHSLELRAELSPEAAVAATLHHGDSVAGDRTAPAVCQVRTSTGVEGWTDSNMLLTPDQMARMRRLSRHAAELPSQGSATVLDKPNAHRTEPAVAQLFPDSGGSGGRRSSASV